MAGETSRKNGQKGGRKPGRKNQNTLEREKVLKEIQRRTMEGADILYDKMMHVALGQAYLFVIRKYKAKNEKGKWVIHSKPPRIVTEPEEIREYLTNIADGPITYDREADYYFITTDKPSVLAIEKMFNRLFGNSVQPVAFTDNEGKSIFDDESKKKTTKVVTSILGRKRNSRNS